MKKLCTLLLIIISLQVFSQDLRLFENTWYLHDLVIDDVSNVPPVNDEIPFVAADFFENGDIETGMCQESGAGELEYIDESQFNILSMGFLQGGCSQNAPFNQTYSGLYQIFWGHSADDIVNYEIIDDGQSRNLIITSSNNDRAIYRNELLSINDFKQNSFSIFPNPVEDLIYVQNKNDVIISKIRVLDLNGRLVQLKEQIVSDNLTINVQKLNKGFYFISLENEENQMLFLKFIKK